MFETGLITFLNSCGALTAFVGTRIYPKVLPPETTLPAIAFNKISAVPDYSHDGGSDFTPIRMQFSCWADDPLEAKNVAMELKRQLSGYSGQLGDQEIGGAFVVMERDDIDPMTGLYAEIVDIQFNNQGK